MNLTIEDIENDIDGFRDRIQTVKAELAALPKGYLPFKQHKRREYEREIEHFLQLI
ncbi:MAG: hypothetical protein U9N83_04065 [Thermodesulfobacteriota bacterium]|nr:hypothetical protein [Thermodesulfobacteriota bacterium]